MEISKSNFLPRNATHPTIISRIAAEGQYHERFIKVVATGLDLSISQWQDKKAIKTLIDTTIEFCAENYTSATNLNEDLLKECTLFVFTNFGFLGVEEIKEAFRSAAAGLTNVDLNTYYGKFNINILGKVLNEYKEYRKAIAKKIQDEHEATNAELRRAYWESEEGKSKIRSHFLNRVSHLKRYPDAASAKDYNYFEKLGVLTFTKEEKWWFMEQARGYIGDNWKRLELESVEMTDEEFLQNKIVCRAKKIAVLHFIKIEGVEEIIVNAIK